VENLYGPTELTIACTVHRWDPVTSPAACVHDNVPIGRPYPGLHALVVDERLAEVGDGVPADARAKIFEPLFTTKARGIGLGLWVSRSLAENNGGTLTLDDTATGACFTLSLPRSPAAEGP
jgi:signal transduction histidine kinase